MKRKRIVMIAGTAGVLMVMGGWTIAAHDKQDKHTLSVPGGLAFSEFKGYENWQSVGPSLTDGAHVIRLIVANPAMIDAYQEGAPGNGKPFPDGLQDCENEWTPKKLTEFIEKDGKRFPDTHGWGYAMFDYDAASGKFTPATSAGKPPQGHDAKCGAACHTLAASKDYIFTAYAKR
jgi:hypothetical protein